MTIQIIEAPSGPAAITDPSGPNIVVLPGENTIEAGRQAGLAQTAKTAAETARDVALAAPLSPTVDAFLNAIGNNVSAFDAAVSWAKSGMILDFTNVYYRSATTVAATLAALAIGSVTQSAVTWAENNDGSLTKFAANTLRVTNKGLLAEGAVTELMGADSDLSGWTVTNATRATGQTAPDGTATAVRITDSGGSYGNTNKTVTVTVAAGTYTATLRVNKESSGANCQTWQVAYKGNTTDQSTSIYIDPVSGAVGQSGGMSAIGALDKGTYWLVYATRTVTAHTSIQMVYYPASRATVGGSDSAGLTGSGTAWMANVTAGSTVMTPAVGNRSADVLSLALPAGYTDDQISLTYGATNAGKTMLRSTLAVSSALNLASDGSAPWLNDYIKKIELKSAATAQAQNIARLKAAIRNLGFYPRPLAALAAGDIPTLTLGTNGAVSTINGVAFTAPTVPRTDAKLTYVSGVPRQAGTAYPQTYFFTARGAYYGTSDGTNPLRQTGHHAFEFVHTGTVFDIPVYGGLSGSGVNLRVLVNGKIAATVSIPNATGGVYFLRNDFPGTGTRTIRIESWGVPCNGVNVASASEVTSVGRDYPLITVMGDSFPEGNSAEVGESQSIVKARALGFNLALGAVGGTGLMNAGGNNTSGYPKVAWTDAERLTDLTLSGVTSAQDGSAVNVAAGFLFLSVNDVGLSSGAWSPYGATLKDAVVNRIDVLLDAWFAANPGKPFFIFGPTWPSGQPNNRPPLDAYRLRDGGAEAAWARSSQNVRFIDRLRPAHREGVYSTSTDQAYLYTGGSSGTDSVHPTAEGHRFDGLADADDARQKILELA